MRARAPRWERIGGGTVWLVLALLVGYPVLRLVAAAGAQGPGATAATLTAGVTTAVANSLWTSAVAAAVAVAAGTGAALVLERGAVPGRGWLRVGVLLPVLVPSFVSALGWSAAFGPGGMLDDLLGVTLPGLFGPAGVVTVIAVNALPLAYLTVAAALQSRAEPDLERAARASGASAWAALVTVTLPLLRPALAAAAVLTFVYSANSFAVPAVLGTPSGFQTMTTRIYSALAFSADPTSFTQVLVLASALVLLALCAVGVADALPAAVSARRTGGPVGAPGAGAGAGAPVPAGGPAVSPPGAGAGAGAGGGGRGRGYPAVCILWAVIGLTTVLPLLALVLVALTRAPGLAAVPANWTLANFTEALRGPALAGLGRSLRLAAAAATLLVPLGGLVTALERSGSRRLGTLVTAGFAVPGSALAVAVLLAYGRWLADTLAIILIAYLGKFWALAHRPVAGAADRLPSELYRAARVSGADGPTALRTVVAPLLGTALAAGWLLVFLFAFHELPMSSLLHGPKTTTLAVVILNLQQLGNRGVTAALAVLLTAGVLLAAAPLLVLRRARR